MFVYRNFSLRNLLKFTGPHILGISLWVVLVTYTYSAANLQWLTIPWLPLSLIGTAVAFYVGFKNNSAYDRMWEARKIWGAMVNSSRSWGSAVRAYVADQFRKESITKEELHSIHRHLLHRHIGWLYVLRSQLLKPTTWEHVSQKGSVGRKANALQKKYEGIAQGEMNLESLQEYLTETDSRKVLSARNAATQIIDLQAQSLAALRRDDLLDDFRHMELQKILNSFYEHQGKAERIKKFPLPRQYANTSLLFIYIFIFLLPLGMASEFMKMGEWALWLSVPFTILVCWVYIMMELVGDYTENPFQGMGNDIPMLSLCRTIEIDLKEMLGEENIPDPIQEKEGVLM